jgi:hypothetical protein
MQPPIRLLRAFIDGHARLDPIVTIANKFDADKTGHAICAACAERRKIKLFVKPYRHIISMREATETV